MTALRPRPLLPVPDRRPRAAPQRLGRTLAVSVLLVLLLLANVWLQTIAAQRGERLRELRAEVDRLRQEQAWLRAELASLRAPDRIERLARQLGLRAPTEGERVFVAVPPLPEPSPAAVDRRPWWVQLVVRLWGDRALAHEGR